MDNSLAFQSLLVGVLALYCAVSLLQMLKPRKLWFRCIFGIWPEENPRLKHLQKVEYVDPLLKSLALQMDICFESQSELHRSISSGDITYKRARKRLSISDKNVHQVKERFNEARDTARRCGFTTYDLYSNYLVG